MANEIEKLTRYTINPGDTNAEAHAMPWPTGEMLDRDDVLAAVAAIEERHARELAEARRFAFEHAREKSISAFLSIIVSGFAEHVVMEAYQKLRGYFDELAKPAEPKR